MVVTPSAHLTCIEAAVVVGFRASPDSLRVWGCIYIGNSQTLDESPTADQGHAPPLASPDLTVWTSQIVCLGCVHGSLRLRFDGRAGLGYRRIMILPHIRVHHLMQLQTIFIDL